MKNRISFDSFCACFQSSYFSISHDLTIEGIKAIELREKKDPMDILFRKEVFRNLSDEAKFVVKMLVFSSQTFLDSLDSPIYKRPTKTTIRRHLFVSGWQHKKIDAVFVELTEYAEKLNFLT